MIERQQLIDSLRSGEPLVVGDGTRPSPERLVSDSAGDFVVEAGLLRSVLLEVIRGKVDDVDPRGLRVRGAAIVGNLDLGLMRIPHSLSLHSCLVDGTVTLTNAEVGGWLRMTGSRLARADAKGWSLRANGLEVDDVMALDEGFETAGGAGLGNAHVRRHLSLRRARLGKSGTHWSVLASRMQVGHGFDADGLTTAGAVLLSASRIGTQLALRGVRLNGATDTGWSLVAQNLQVDSDVFLDGGFEATGAITLHGARIAGQLGMVGARVHGRSDQGWSLDGQDLRIGQGAFLRDGFEMAGPLNLDGAEIGGQLSMRAARLGGHTDQGWSVNGRNLRVAHDALLGPDLQLAGSLYLVGSRFHRLAVAAGATEPPPLANVAGWQLGDLIGRPRTDPGCAARWLDSQTTAQPWQELANLYDRIGQPSDARWIRYRSAVRSARHGSRSSRVASWFSRWTTGHGYYPVRRTLTCLLAVFVIALLLSSQRTDDFTTATTATIRQAVLDDQRVAGATNPAAVPGRVPASAWDERWDVAQFQPLTYALSTAVPTTSSATSQPWTPRTGWLSAVLAVLRALSWIFTALFLAGITGLLRKQT
ncbi:hypothetical protein [Nocardioides sp. LML1-1-1.1]|uniref:hypothetical protein n=1 Tax=Nocardioides sp. LML1-1-1.1 TaxID=3135248 RepID=UPI00342811E4